MKRVLLLSLCLLTGFGLAQRVMPPADPVPTTDRAKQLLSMDFVEADLQSVLRLLAEQNNFNLVVNEDISGTVTVHFVNVTLKGALDAILKANGYDYLIQDNIIIIKPIDSEMEGETISRVYKLDYISANDAISPLEDVLTPKGKIQVFQRTSELSQSGGEELGDTRADELVITDTPQNFTKIEEVIKNLDVPVPQVMISVKFIETILSDNENMGIDWTAKATLMGGPARADPSGLAIPATGGGVGGGGGITGGGTQGGIGGGGTGGLGIGHFKELNLAILTMQEFQMVLDYLKSKGNSKILSDPRIATLDNHRATFTTETELTVIVPTVAQGATGALAAETAQQYTIKIELIVMPHVHKNGQITMVVEPTVEGITGYSGPDLDQPIISRRNAKTQVRVNNGETIALGGLIKEDTRTTTRKVPFLGDLPILGKLFTYHSNEKQKSDLLIFITPHLVYSDEKTE
ncbi:MAG: hypothetical protein D6762_03360 [Candidatus Neomarinimicrobiota bacterium]|nr:MAG: hypothetical protein D6762_03360 [Candidatus Neomarinimicrobiota bacterium]